MAYKILIADDSQTIQKVINITLSSEPYQLFECLSSSDLVKSVQEHKPDLIFLDFNLSEDKTGYDLCQDVKNAHANTQVVYLMGTFDTIDEALIHKSGATNWIVKPFDGNKFIGLCRALLQDSEEALPERISAEEVEIEETISSPPQVEESLSRELEDWGIEVPAVISGGGENLELPPVIDNELTGHNNYPEETDLEYPSLNDFPEKIDLQTEIEDEVDDLWKVDEGQGFQIEEAVEELIIEEPIQTPDDFPKDVMEESVAERVEEEIAKSDLLSSTHTDEIVRQECKAIIERIAWEVIPDLAENIIRAEVQKIRDEVLGK